MSHIVTIKVKVRCLAALQAACNRLGLAAPAEGTHTVYTQKVKGHGVKLPGWHYPAVFDMKTGTGVYDNYKGDWGDQKELDRLMQAYGVEKAKLELRRKGMHPIETVRADGSIVLTATAV